MDELKMPESEEDKQAWVRAWWATLTPEQQAGTRKVLTEKHGSLHSLPRVWQEILGVRSPSTQVSSIQALADGQSKPEEKPA